MKVIVFIAILGFMGCQNVKHPEKPENLIGKSTMVDVLADAYLANAARSVDYRTVRNQGLRLDSLIYKKYNIDSLQFAQSNAFYADNLDTYIEMFKKVELKLQTMSDSLTPKKDSIPETPKVKDSLI